MKSLISYISLLILLGGGSGCSTLSRNAVPIDKMFHAGIPGMTDVRAWSGRHSEQLEQDLLTSIDQYWQYKKDSNVATSDVNVLVLSGGGDSGAFGAGFMNGWSRSGTRPEFKLVTGISTGAIIAPFNFLGPKYDAVLKEAYTTIKARDIFQPRWFSIFGSEAFADTRPLKNLIERYITKNVLDEVAQAHYQGRRLWIGTTNLDADHLVVWNMGAIASSGHPDALKLFRQIIVASSSIPGAFPPVLIGVEADGMSYDEMHVDGGVKAQLFILAATLDLPTMTKKVTGYPRPDRKLKIFVIRNAKVGPEPNPVPRKLSKITRRAFSSLIKSQARNDLERIYVLAKQQDVDFNWVSVPNEYREVTSTPFDTMEMNRVFNIGYELGLKGNAWRKVPPKFDQP